MKKTTIILEDGNRKSTVVYSEDQVKLAADNIIIKKG